MFSLTRRRFLQAGPLALAATHARPSRLGRTTSGHFAHWLTEERSPDPKEFQSLTAAALDAAKAAGAEYTDVHIQVLRVERLGGVEGTSLVGLNPARNTFTVGVGVRSLVRGYWGHAGLDGFIDLDGAAKLGRDSARQAVVAATGKPRVVDLAPAPIVTGTWVMPVEIDPFTVSYEEKYDFLVAMDDFIARTRSQGNFSVPYGLECTKDERTFASSTGSYTTQTTFSTSGGFAIMVPGDWMTGRGAQQHSDFFLSMGGAGWEYMKRAPYRDYALQIIEQGRAARRPKPGDTGRFDVVFDAQTLSSILSRTIGAATRLDRAMGDQADGVGTSYLNNPLEKLGTYRAGSSLLNVTTNRSMPGGISTVKWDDEGVAPSDATLVKNGILTDYQTTRESASWLAPYYQKFGRPVRSNGCADAPGTQPMGTRTPNLVMQPGADDMGFDDLVKQVAKGLAVVAGWGNTDFQLLNGTCRGDIVYAITDGKITGTVSGVELLFRAPEFWRNLSAIGGARSSQTFGESGAGGSYTVACVPGLVKGVAVTATGSLY